MTAFKIASDFYLPEGNSPEKTNNNDSGTLRFSAGDSTNKALNSNPENPDLTTISQQKKSSDQGNNQVQVPQSQNDFFDENKFTNPNREATYSYKKSLQIRNYEPSKKDEEDLPTVEEILEQSTSSTSTKNSKNPLYDKEYEHNGYVFIEVEQNLNKTNPINPVMFEVYEKSQFSEYNKPIDKIYIPDINTAFQNGRMTILSNTGRDSIKFNLEELKSLLKNTYYEKKILIPSKKKLSKNLEYAIKNPVGLGRTYLSPIDLRLLELAIIESNDPRLSRLKNFFEKNRGVSQDDIRKLFTKSELITLSTSQDYEKEHDAIVDESFIKKFTALEGKKTYPDLFSKALEVIEEANLEYKTRSKLSFSTYYKLKEVALELNALLEPSLLSHLERKGFTSYSFVKIQENMFSDVPLLGGILLRMQRNKVNRELKAIQKALQVT